VTSRYLLDAGGKRIRPVLALLTAQLGTGNNANVITAAEAIEMTHLASLYHDDVMDEAQVRRGVPSAQTVWGNSVAILTGDLLFARASKLVAGMGERAILLQAETFERLCLGQLHETIGPRPGEDPIEHYLQVLADKTGSLIATAAQVGLMFSDAPEECLDRRTRARPRAPIFVPVWRHSRCSTCANSRRRMRAPLHCCSASNTTSPARSMAPTIPPNSRPRSPSCANTRSRE